MDIELRIGELDISIARTLRELEDKRHSLVLMYNATQRMKAEIEALEKKLEKEKAEIAEGWEILEDLNCRSW